MIEGEGELDEQFWAASGANRVHGGMGDGDDDMGGMGDFGECISLIILRFARVIS